MVAAVFKQGWRIVTADLKGSTVPDSVDTCDEEVGCCPVTRLMQRANCQHRSSYVASNCRLASPIAELLDQTSRKPVRDY